LESHFSIILLRLANLLNREQLGLAGVLKIDAETTSPEDNIKNLKRKLSPAASIKIKGICYIKSI